LSSPTTSASQNYRGSRNAYVRPPALFHLQTCAAGCIFLAVQ